MTGYNVLPMQMVGVDVGGTWIRSGFVDESGVVSCRDKRRTPSERPPNEIIDSIVESIQTVAGADVDVVGIGIPTTVDQRGHMRPCPNLPTMTDVSVATEIGERIGYPVHVENDARCYAYGEWSWGAGERCHSMVLITLGTSVGMATIVQGKILGGFRGEAGEIWRSPLSIGERPTDTNAVVHDILSSQGVRRAYREATGKSLSAEGIAEQAAAGDSNAIAVYDAYAFALARVVSWVRNVMDPEKIVLGGSFVQEFDLVTARIEDTAGDTAATVVKGRLGDEAAIVGAAAIAAHAGEYSI